MIETKYINEKQIGSPSSEIILKLKNEMSNLNWEILFQDSYNEVTKNKVSEIFGLSDSFGSSIIGSLFNRGSRNVPFFIKIKSLDLNITNVIIITGGSEGNIFDDPKTRNKEINEKIMSICTDD